MAIAWVLRYAAKVRTDPSRVAGRVRDADAPPSAADRPPGDGAEPGAGHAASTLTGTQKWVLVITGLAFGLMIFSVIPWSSIFGGRAGPAEDDYCTTYNGARRTGSS